MRNYQPRPRCGARKDGGGTCRNGAGAGTDHPGTAFCSNHSGATPDGRKYAQRVQAEEAVQKWGLPIVTTAVDALATELNRTFGRVTWLASKVETLDEEGLETSPWPALERWERRHLAELAVKMVSLDLDGRRVNLMELVGKRLADGLDLALVAAGVPPAQAARVLQLLPGALDGTGR
jgi:hypothetical protein